MTAPRPLRSLPAAGRTQRPVRDDLRPNPERPRRVLLTVPEVAAEMRLSKMTVYRLIHSGELRALRVGRAFRVDATDLDEYMRGAETVIEDDR